MGTSDTSLTAPAPPPPALPATAPAPLGFADLLAARHPLYDDKLRVVAYELVLHSRDSAGRLLEGQGAGTPEQVHAVAQQLVGSRPVHVRVPRQKLLDGGTLALPPERIVLEVAANPGGDRPLVAALWELRAAGHTMVLRGTRWDTESVPLLQAASGVKMDVSALPAEELDFEVARLRRHHDGGLIASGVKSSEMLHACRGLGFSLFQGFHFLDARIPEDGDDCPNQAPRARLLELLEAPGCTLEDAQRAISFDMGLSYALVRAVGSAFSSLPRKLHSVRDAAVLFGMEDLRRWVGLAVSAGVESRQPDGLTVAGLSRARMCEKLAHAYGEHDTDAFFTTGLFSIMDQIVDAPMIQVLSSLPISEEIVAAILNYQGVKGEALRAALMWEEVNSGELIVPPGMTAGMMDDVYRESVSWAAATVAGNWAY